MRNRRLTPTPAISFVLLALAALFAGWSGCSATGSTHLSTGSGGNAAASAAGGAGGAGHDAGGCSETEKVCDGVCVAADDPKYGCSPTYCTPCPSYPNAGAACSAGACMLGTCNAGFKNCDGNAANGCETDVATDPMNCGVCGGPCVLVHATTTCTHGTCTVVSCDMGGWTDCSAGDGGTADGGTVDVGCSTNTQSDPMNCGACGAACPGQETCQSGECGLACPKGFDHCPGDPPNQCATVLGTDKNCNFCGDACNLFNSTSHCVPDTMPSPPNPPFVCSLDTCNPGWENCDMVATNGCETNTTTNANHCSSCGNACPSGPHSTAVCTGSVCGLACDPGYADCDKNPLNGCEVFTNGDTSNCGACGTTCSTNNATETCTAGVCTILVCSSGYADCDKNAANGCEDNVQADPLNCGTCGDICKTNNGTPACIQGSCTAASCNAGYAHCPGQAGTNCETVISNDVHNCGACGNVCSSNNDTPSCSAGQCSVTCSALFGNCDNNVANGCETPLSSVGSCGACGNACFTQNGTPICVVNGTTATCALGSCTAGYASCPGDGNNCLTNITTTTNCGTCGNACAGDATNPALHDSGACTGGACSVGTCDPGWADCNGLVADGCETPLNTIQHCGACNVACSTANGTPACNNVGGVWTCQIAGCTAGFTHCPGQPGTNCETNTNSDNANCGSCGNNCLATCGGAVDHVAATSCTNGTCGVTSCTTNPSYVDFDGQCSDGCECLASTTQSACGNAAGLFSGSLQPGQSITPFTSTMAPMSVTQAYFTLTFGGNGGTSFHPKISIVSFNNEFLMDITTNCNASPITTCTDHGTLDSDGVLTWETSYVGPSPAADPNSKGPNGTTSNFNAIPLPGSNGQVWIRVYRRAGATPTCDTYTITASD